MLTDGEYAQPERAGERHEGQVVREGGVVVEPVEVFLAGGLVVAFGRELAARAAVHHVAALGIDPLVGVLGDEPGAVVAECRFAGERRRDLVGGRYHWGLDEKNVPRGKVGRPADAIAIGIGRLVVISLIHRA